MIMNDTQMENFSGANIKLLVKEFEQKFIKAKQKQDQIGIASNIISDSDTTEDNITLRLVEYLPEISVLAPPILSKQESKTLVSVAPRALNKIKKVATPFKNDPKNFDGYCAEVFYKLNHLSDAKSDVINMLFVNRFILLQGLKEKSADNPSLKHTLYVATKTIEVSTEFLPLAKSFLDDLKMILQS